MPVPLGPLSLDPPVFLAPLAGITDLPFRRLVSRFNAGLVVSEMVASEEIVRNRPEARARAELGFGEQATSVQLAGRDPYWMAEGAKFVEGVLFPLNQVGVLQGCTRHEDGSVTTAEGFKEFVRLSETVARAVRVRSSLPPVSEPEITEAVTWTLEFFIPFALLEEDVGPLGEVAGQTWRGNFFKCAEENSHPHWAAWSPVDEFNFHRPHCFGELRFR